MIQDRTIPFVGETLSYHPDKTHRFAAICVEVHDIDIEERPKLNLQVFQPNGEVSFIEKVPPVKVDIEGGEPELAESWSFLHEHELQHDPDFEDEGCLGTQTNVHVGDLTLIS